MLMVNNFLCIRNQINFYQFQANNKTQHYLISTIFYILSLIQIIHLGYITYRVSYFDLI